MVRHLDELVNVSVKVPRELREQMRRVDVDWSDYLRRAIEAKVRAEISRNAMRVLDEIRGRASEVPTEELVRWIREERRRGLEWS